MSTYKGETLSRLLSAGRQAREHFDKQAEEIARYDYGHEIEHYQNWDTSLSFYAKVYKAQQFKREVGARLYKDNPVFRLSPKRQADEGATLRTELMTDYLNEVVKENGFFWNLRSALNNALSSGRGVLWYGLDPNKDGVVTAVADSPQNLLIDPDAKHWGQVNWVARKRFRPKWQLMKQFPGKRDIILGMPAANKASDAGYRGNGGGNQMLVEYYELYTRVGLHNFRGGIDETQLKNVTRMVDVPRKYTVTENGIILDESQWEVPFHLDGSWPCEVLDFYENPNSIWPISPLEPGIGWIKAINWVTTLLVAKYQWSSKTVLAMLRNNGVELDPEDIEKITSPDGSLLEVIRIASNHVGDGTKVGDLIEQVDFTTDIQEGLAILDHLNDEFEKSTGLHDFLYNGSAGVQDRSAAATQARKQNTETRIYDMQSRIEEFLSRVGRKMAMTARYLLDPEDVAPIVGRQGAQLWGVLLEQEQLTPEYWVRKYTDQGMSMQDSVLMAQDMLQGATSLEQWVHEVDYTVEAGSTMRRTPEQESEAIADSLNTILPALTQIGAMRSAAELLVQHGRATGLPYDALETIQQELQEIQQAQQAAMQQTEPGGAPGQPGVPGMPAMPQGA